MPNKNKEQENAQERINSDSLATKARKARMLEALLTNQGIVLRACTEANVGHSTYYEWLWKDPEFKEMATKTIPEMSRVLGEMKLDLAEEQLFTNMKDGNAASTIFYLKTHGKKRGYAEGTTAQPVPPPSVTFKRTDEPRK